MSRYRFGGDLAAWAYSVSNGNVVPASNVAVTFWSASTGGTEYTDLASDAGGTPLGGVTTSSGSGGTAPGAIPLFWGPDGVTAMWAAVGSSPRQLIVSNDVPMMLAGAQTITGTKTFDTGDGELTRIILRANATGQAADLLQAWSSSEHGQGGAAQRTTYLNEKGELRVIAAKDNSVAVRFKGQPGQTANVFEHTDTSNVAVAWMAANGSWRAPNLGHTFAMSIAGTIAVATGAHRIYNDTGVPLTIRAVRATVGTAPTGAAIRVDVNRNGTSIFTNQNNRPNIAVGTNTAKVTNMDVTSIADGEYLTVDVDAVGSTVAGADLVVQILAS